MKSSLVTEIKTILYSKIFYISLIVVTLISSAFMIQSYINANVSVDYLLELYNEFIADGTEFDYNEIVTPIKDYFYTYSPYLSINNSSSVLVGIGMLILPITYSIYVGNEYKKGTVKSKISISSLPKIVFSKYIVLVATLASYLVVYILIHYCLSVILYNKYFLSINLPDYIVIDDVNFGLLENLKGIFIVYISLLFYISLCMLMSYFFKNAIAGVIMTLVINFVTLPTKFAPHNIVFQLLNKYLYISESSPVSFSLQYSFSNNTQPLFFLIIYTVLVFISMFIISKVQRN